MSGETTTENRQNPDFWTISGRVSDGTTGKPVTCFQVTHGNEGFFGRIELDDRTRAQGVDGAFTIHLTKRVSLPVLKVEATGYFPALVTPPQEDRTNFDITLHPGVGPSGRVLSPDGKPAVNVAVALICSGHHYCIAEGGILKSWRDPVKGDMSRSWQQPTMVRKTNAEGQFAFPPELKMERIVAASPDGIAMVSLGEFEANPNLELKPWGRIKGVLKRPSGPGVNEHLDLIFAREATVNEWSFDTGNHVVTNSGGCFEFERVPPVELKLTYRVKIDERKWRSVPLQSVSVSPGQTLELRIEAAEPKTEKDLSTPQPKSPSKGGLPITGVVLLSTGKPAVGAEVGLVVPNHFLALHKTSLQTGPDASLKTTTDTSGHFTFPGVQGVKGIVAVNADGFAKVQVEPGSQPARLLLQSWGQISGTLRIGDRFGANERVVLRPGSFQIDMSFNYSNEFQAKTDGEGRFVLTYVPPGEQRLCRVIQGDKHASHDGPPTTVEVKAGGITHVTIGGTGRRVVGKAVPKTPAMIDWHDVKVSLVTSQYAPPKNVKTKEERQAWYESAEGQAACRKMRHYKASIGANGDFGFEDVEPGDYSLSVSRERKIQVDCGLHHHMMMVGGKKVSVPTAVEDGVNPCDVGTVEVCLPAEFPALPE